MLSHQLYAKLVDDSVPTEILKLTAVRSIFRVKDLESKDKCTVVIQQGAETCPQTGAVYDSVRCNCRYFLSNDLFCAHIFSVFNILQIKTTEKFHTVGGRWTKAHQETVVPGLYSKDQHLNPQAFADQFTLYNRANNPNMTN